MVADREPYLSRGRDCARLTDPMLLPPNSYPGRTNNFPTPYQSVGARGVNHLSSKIMLALFPPNMPFFRYRVDDAEVQSAMDADKETKGVVEEGLAAVEQGLLSDFERAALRMPLTEAVKHLLVCGNILLYVDPKTNKGRAIPLSRYCVTRDASGNTLDIAIMEQVDEEALDEDTRKKLEEHEQASGEDVGEKGDSKSEDKDEEPSTDNDDEVVIYTRVTRCEKHWRFVQEINGCIIAEGKYALDKCAWLPLRLVAVDGENYGRGLIEQYYGDLSSLEKLTKAMVQFAAAAAKIIFLTNPNSTTKPNKLVKAQTGDFVPGKKSDIEVLQIEKYADFQVAKSVADSIMERLSYAFLMYSAIQRNGERVTAQEIRLMAQELDSGFGGIYATLAQELQLQLIILLQANRQRRGLMKGLEGFTSKTRPTLVTGLEALGRGQDLQNLLSAMSILGQYPAFVQRLNTEELIKRVFASTNVNPQGLIIEEEQWQQMQRAAALQASLGPAGAEAVKGYARHAGAIAAQQPADTSNQQPAPTSIEAATPSRVDDPQVAL